MGFNSMRVIGPMIGGLLIVLFGPAINFALQGVLFGAVFLLLLKFRLRNPDKGRDASGRQSVLRSLGEGFSYVLHDPVTLSVTMMTVALALAVMSVVQNQLPVFTAEVMGDTEGGVLGLLFTSLGVGGLAGTILIARFSHYPRKGLQGLTAFAGAAVSLLVLSQVTTLWAAVPTLVALQLFIQSVLTSNMTIVQAMTPDVMRGRVIGVYQMEIGLSPVGGIIAGIIASAYGVSIAFLIGGIAAVVAFAAFAVGYRELRELRL
jgi:MFS family permease